MENTKIPPPGNAAYQEFARCTHLSAGVYRLPPNAVDGQQPHREDELYVVLSGSARFTASGKTVDVRAGAVLLVLAGEVHRFHDISEPLEVLVVFGPAEGSSNPA